MSVFEDRMREPDYYLKHMARTMEWIEEKMRENARDEGERDPTLKLKGYDVAITVEARWLQQLVAENVGMHQMLQYMQYQMAHAATTAAMFRPDPVLMEKKDVGT